MSRYRRRDSNGTVGWMIFLTGFWWFFAVCVVSIAVALIPMVCDDGYEAAMMGAFLFPALWIGAPVAVLMNLGLTLKHFGLAPWARLTTVAVALVVAFATTAATALLFLVR